MKPSLDREVVAAEDRLTEATRSVDVATLDRLYADEIIFTGVTGAICDKNAIMDEARRGQAERRKAAETPGMPSVVSYNKYDLQGVRHGDTAVASFSFGITVRNAGQEVTRRYRTTNVWLKRNGEWQVVAAPTAALG
jgi:ketosteroid isomerase-like protein